MRIVYKIIKIERSISRSKGKKEIETIILFMERNTRRSENDRDSLTFRGGYGYRSYRAVFSTDVGTVVPRKTRNDDRPIKLTPRPTILYLCSFRFFFFSFSLLFFAPTSIEENDPQVQRSIRKYSFHGRVCKMKYISCY